MTTTNPFAVFGDVAQAATSAVLNSLTAVLPIVLPFLAIAGGIKYILTKVKFGSVAKS